MQPKEVLTNNEIKALKILLRQLAKEETASQTIEVKEVNGCFFCPIAHGTEKAAKKTWNQIKSCFEFFKQKVSPERSEGTLS